MRKLVLLSIVLVSGAFFQEENFISELKARSDNYFTKVARAKLELLFNQPKYAPGDTVFFRTTYVNASDLKPVKGTQVVHVSLFDQSGQKKITQSFSVSNGYASNRLTIPDDIKPGNYVLVAFTDWMKNADQSLFFQKQFLIAGQHDFEKKYASDSIMFYPEGGSLVANVNNNLAIRYTGAKPKSKIIIRESGIEIASLLLARDSVSVFSFKPKLNGGYEAELSTEQVTKKFAFPKVNQSGISISAQSAERQIKLNLEASGSELAQLQLYLAVFNNKGLAFHSPLDFSSEVKRTVMLPQNLSDGVAQVVVVDSKMQIWASRVIHFDKRQLATAKVENLAIGYVSRQRVKLTVQALGSEGYGADAFFACQVINESLFPSQEEGMDYLTFGSDISNTFELKKNTNPTIINNYLITQSCPWFDWKKITEKNDAAVLHKAQPYLSLSGKATYAKNGLPVRDSTMIMFFLENSLRGYETYSGSKGHFNFPLVLNIFSNDDFFIAGSYKGKDADEIKIKIEDPDSLISFKAESWIENEIADPYSTYSLQKKTINRSYSFFMNSKTLRDSTFDPNKAMEIELNGADITLNLKDYLQMPTVEDVTRELLRGVEYRKINGRQVVRVNTTGKVPSNHAGPLYMIDGQITKDPSHFLGLKPADIVSIKVVKDSKKLLALGKLGANGIILITTKGRAVINEKNKIGFSGLLPVAMNYTHMDGGKNLPDIRSCLYWSPLIRSSSTGPSEIQFTTSDDIGNYKIQFYGRTEDGRPVFYEQSFEVKYSGN